MARLIASPALIRLTEPASPVSSGVNRFSVPPLYCQPPALSYAPRVWYVQAAAMVGGDAVAGAQVDVGETQRQARLVQPPAGWVYGP